MIGTGSYKKCIAKFRNSGYFVCMSIGKRGAHLFLQGGS